MSKYFKKPVNEEVEAQQYTTPAQATKLAAWAGGTADGVKIDIPTAHGHPRVDAWVAYVGDWIIREDPPVDQDGKPLGEPIFHTCTDDQFKALFYQK